MSVQRQIPVLQPVSGASSSPLHMRQKSVAPPADLRQSTPLPQTPQQPVPILNPSRPTKDTTPVPRQRSFSSEHTPASPTSQNPASPSSSAWPIPVRKLVSSKSNPGASAAKSLAGPSFLGLREPDARFEGSPWGAYNASFSRRPGVGHSCLAYSSSAWQ